MNPALQFLDLIDGTFNEIFEEYKIFNPQVRL